MSTGAETPLLSVISSATRQAGGVLSAQSSETARTRDDSQKTSETVIADEVTLSADAALYVQEFLSGQGLSLTGRGELVRVPDQGEGEAVAEASSPAQADKPDFRQLVEEFQERLQDENRLPPSIMNQIKKLLETALEQSADNKVNIVA